MHNLEKNEGENTSAETLAHRIDELLAQTGLFNHVDELDSLIETVLSRLVNSSSIEKKLLGSRLASLRKAKQSIDANPITWVKVSGGKLSLGPRPKEKTIAQMPWYGVTHVFTLQAQTEKAVTIGTLVEKHLMNWLWFPMASADLPSNEKQRELLQLFGKIREALSEGAAIYVHCAAGIHRTGMIAYGLLRYLGYSESDADKLLLQLRSETAHGVGEERKAWATRLYAPATHNQDISEEPNEQ